MRISTRGRYAMEAVLALVLQPGEKPVSLGQISRETGLPRQYLEQIFSSMKQAGLVCGERGSRGGYRLAADPSVLTAGDVLRAVEGGLAPVHCLMPAESGKKGTRPCTRTRGCRTRPVWTGLEQAIEGFLDQKTLAELMRQYLGGDKPSS